VLAVAIVLGAVAVVLGAAAVFVLARNRSQSGSGSGSGAPARPRPVYSAAQPLSSLVVEALDQGVIVLDADDRVVLLNPAARAMDLVDVDRLSFPDLAELADHARATSSHRPARSICPSAGWAANRSHSPSRPFRSLSRTGGLARSGCC
jgi:two-component system sensor histidine kinase SenX3